MLDTYGLHTRDFIPNIYPRGKWDITAGMYTDPSPSYIISVILSDSGTNDEKFREGGES